METSKRGQWGSSFGFLMAAIGSAIGLGNLWAFPYKMGKTGGFAFLVLRRYAGERFACLFSALSFALYHGDDARVVFSASFSSRTRGACRGRRTF